MPGPTLSARQILIRNRVGPVGLPSDWHSVHRAGTVKSDSVVGVGLARWGFDPPGPRVPRVPRQPYASYIVGVSWPALAASGGKEVVNPVSLI